MSSKSIGQVWLVGPAEVPVALFRQILRPGTRYLMMLIGVRMAHLSLLVRQNGRVIAYLRYQSVAGTFDFPYAMI